MKRQNFCVWVTPFLLSLACNGDGDNVNASNSNDGSGTRGTDDMSGGATDSMADASGTGGQTEGNSQGSNSNSGADSSGTADGTVSASGTMSDDNGTIGGEGSGDTTGGNDDATGDDATGGVELPPIPEDPPGTLTGPCVPGELRYCWSGDESNYNIGICEPGLQQCVPIDLDIGTWGPCEDEQGPESEVCDGHDNNCDGDTDEGLGQTNCGLSSCNHDEDNCIAGVPNECDPFQGAIFEICDKEDNDCDGDIDEGLGEDVVTCGVGVCEHTVTDCEGGGLPDCDPFEGMMAETCDGLDNDCDGDTDEDIPTQTCGQFDCEVTVPGCIGGFVPTCTPLPPDPEICDGDDNDCDGLTDEGMGVWTCGDFACANMAPMCLGGVPQPESSCVPFASSPELCGNGIDEDCDGEDPPCAETYLVGSDTAQRPIDIIWMIDSSGSMAQEIATVEAEINNFANALDAAGNANQLHLIADRGTGAFEMCVTPPLGGAACADNPPQFRQYDTNGASLSMVHSSNAIGRVIQQYASWGPNLQPNSYIAFIVTTDDDGDDVNWIAPDDLEPTDDCQGGGGNINNGTTGNVCRFNDGLNTYTSLANDFGGMLGFASFMTNYFPGFTPGTDWAWHSIIGNTGTTVLGAGHPDNFNGCGTSVEDGDEYVKLSQLTGVTADMFSICAAPWDLTGLADAITGAVPNDTYILQGDPIGTCLNVDPLTITVIVNGVPMNPADWSYDAPSCTVTINNNVPVVGDNVVIIYQNT